MLPRHSRYYQLFVTSRRLAWDPLEVDLSRDAESWRCIVRDHSVERYDDQMLLLLALFHAGEQSVTETLAPFMTAIARLRLGIDKEMFLTAQLHEEAAHYEFFSRYLDDVMGPDVALPSLPAQPRAVLVDDLAEVTERLCTERDPQRLTRVLVEGLTHYMGIVEAMLARTGYRGVHEALAARGWLPGLQEGFAFIRRDEGRHVAFGMHLVREMVSRDPSLAETVQATFERHLPNVLETVNLFDYPHPLAPVEPLQSFAIAAYERFMAAAGLVESPAGVEDLDTDC